MAGLGDAEGSLPGPPAQRAPWVFAGTLALLCAGVIAAVLTGAVGANRVAPPPLPATAATPKPAATTIDPRTDRRVYVSNVRPTSRSRIVSQPPASGRRHGSSAQRQSAQAGGGDAANGGERGASSSSGRAGGRSGRAAEGAAEGIAGGGAGSAAAGVSGGTPAATISRRWMEGFYPIYAQAQRVFGVSWLLIASIHRQETAFSTAPSTYHGLNFAGCCAGPMQFNVTDGGGGALSTWAMMKDSYRYGRRPPHYDHRTAHHPSIYDDFDSIMAAAHLLALDGAGHALNDSAWWAAYDYYGHDIDGIRYADEVLARAIGWSQHGFCAGCALNYSLARAVQAAYGAPVLAAAREAERAAAAKTRREREQAARRARIRRSRHHR